MENMDGCKFQLGGIILAITLILGIAFIFYRKNMSLYDGEKNPDIEIVVAVKNAQDKIEGIVDGFYKKQPQKELWIVDCGSQDQTPQILQRLFRRYHYINVLFMSNPSVKAGMQEVIRYTKGHAVLLIDGNDLSYKQIKKLINLTNYKKNVKIGLKTYEI